MDIQRKASFFKAILLGAAVLICLFFLLYAFVQKAEADRQFSNAEHERMNAEACAYQSSQRMKELEKMKLKLEEANRKVEACSNPR